MLRSDWKDHQGPPSPSLRASQAKRLRLHVITDHSQDYQFQPPSPTNPTWLEAKRSATAATTSSFVAIAGYEHSENDGPDGVGYINVMDTDAYLNALDHKVDLKYLYKWLKTAKPNGNGPIVASFNYPGHAQYNDWAYRRLPTSSPCWRSSTPTTKSTNRENPMPPVGAVPASTAC